MSCENKLNSGKVLSFVFLVGSICSSTAFAQSAPPADNPAVTPHQASPSALTSQPTTHPKSRYRPSELSPRAIEHYRLIWGVDSFLVKSAESGQMIRFSYFVRDAKKAEQLNDKKAAPYLIDQRARVSLVIPTMEKVGQLRQSSPPEAGKSYWMLFSNKGNVVKAGDPVSVVIGKFRVDGLVVQ
jgi:hypothetical protein